MQNDYVQAWHANSHGTDNQGISRAFSRAKVGAARGQRGEIAIPLPAPATMTLRRAILAHGQSCFQNRPAGRVRARAGGRLLHGRCCPHLIPSPGGRGYAPVCKTTPQPKPGIWAGHRGLGHAVRGRGARPCPPPVPLNPVAEPGCRPRWRSAGRTSGSGAASGRRSRRAWSRPSPQAPARPYRC